MKQEQKTEKTKDRIITAAVYEFGRYGYYGSSLNNICGSKISKGLLYHNFDGKDALYLACVKKCFHELTAYLKATEIGTDFTLYTKKRIAFFKDNESLGRIFFEAVLQPPMPLQDQIHELRGEFDSFNQELFEKILDSLTLRDGISKTKAIKYFSIVQELFNGYFTSPACLSMDEGDAFAIHEEAICDVIDHVLYGIAKEPSTSARKNIY